MGIDLPLIWAAIIAVGVIMYVILDGFDLGIGILFPFFREKEDRDTLMNSVVPVWDGNETWMILGGAGLLGAFPLAYSVLLSTLYLPLILMLVALIFRGVAFEFRFKAEGDHRWWDRSFVFGSWLTPFSIFVGVSLLCGYVLLGAGWLLLKTEGALQERVWEIYRPLLVLVFLAMAAISLWTPLADPRIGARWFAWPNKLYLLPAPALVALLAYGLFRAVQRHQERRPFLMTLGLFVLSYLCLAISLWPNIIPPSVTIWDAASPAESQGFMLVGTLVLLPIIIGYTAYSYWIFRGQVRGEHYH